MVNRLPPLSVMIGSADRILRYIGYKNIGYFSIMKKSTVAVCQMCSTSDKVENLETVSTLVKEAKQRSAIVVFFPEACDYLADNKKDIVSCAEPLDGPTISNYKSLASQHNIWLSIGGFHEAIHNNPSKIYNTHVLINDQGEIVEKYRKIHLFDMNNKVTGIRLMESDYVEQGSEITPPIITPIGKLGLSICYDVRFPELSLIMRKMGAEILTYPSAFTYQTGASHWEILLRARACETQCYVIAAAQFGKHNHKRTSWGHAMVVDPYGTVVAQCSENTGLVVADIDLNLLQSIRNNMPCNHHRRIDLYSEIMITNNKC